MSDFFCVGSAFQPYTAPVLDLEIFLLYDKAVHQEPVLTSHIGIQ